jgi:hypothetical protein
MDQRFSAFFLEKYKLELQRGARSFYEDDISDENVIRPNRLRRLMSLIVTWIIASSKVPKQKDNIVMKPHGTTHQKLH